MVSGFKNASFLCMEHDVDSSLMVRESLVYPRSGGFEPGQGSQAKGAGKELESDLPCNGNCPTMGVNDSRNRMQILSHISSSRGGLFLNDSSRLQERTQGRLVRVTGSGTRVTPIGFSGTF